jgi:hypothetical protein
MNNITNETKSNLKNLCHLISITGFHSNYKIDQNATGAWRYADTTKVRHAGTEVALSIPLFMGFKPIIPYGGVACQFSGLGANVSVFG